ncbi:GTP-binding protein [Candidatus Carsonella ruddii]|uniref:Translation elongation factor LepA n=1 Tax=Carsonella ruddii TaxID=114186 RepID=A0A1U9RRX0_CARRU|nr:GTP-binding protein [Candidatus Carsonella ruddii]AQU89529.1 Translation elongation factor LepA [Candidatus Carsonella ruddii]
MNLANNISIIAHVDHGKTTLLNSLINFCKKIINYKKKFFFLNNYFYTIKLNIYSVLINKKIINFIDCPGHFDFINEIYKAIIFSEICLILIDVYKGIEPQTLFCYNLSKKFNKIIIIFINKIDIYVNFKKIKNKLLLFNKKQKIFFISSKYSIGLINLFYIKKKIYFKKEKIIFILEYLNNLKYGEIIIVKILSGIIYLKDNLKNKNNDFIKVLKIGIFLPKNFFIKKTFINCIHFLIIDKQYNKKFLFFYNNNNNFYFNKFNVNIYFTVYLKENFFIFKLINNDYSIFFKKKVSILFGNCFFLGFIGNLHSEIFFKKLKILSKFWITNPIIFFLFNKKNIWIIDIFNEKNFLEYEQIVIVNLYVLKKNFFLIIQLIFNFNYYKIKIKQYDNLLILIFYINLYKIINNFFVILNNKINGFLFYEFKFHHFLKSKLYFIKVYINNKIIEEFNLIIEDNITNNCFIFFQKIKKNIKNNLVNIDIKFIHQKRVIFSKKIFCYKKNVLEKCYGGDITRKIKLINKQNEGKKIMQKMYNFYLDKKIIINIIKNEFSNI